MSRKVLLSLLIAASCVFMLVQTVEALEPSRINGDSWFGCTSKEGFEKIVQIVSQGDREAFKRAMLEGILNGIITIFENGEHVYIVDTSIFSGMIKVRRKGETKEYWTNYEAIK